MKAFPQLSASVDCSRSWNLLELMEIRQIQFFDLLFFFFAFIFSLLIQSDLI